MKILPLLPTILIAIASAVAVFAAGIPATQPYESATTTVLVVTFLAYLIDIWVSNKNIHEKQLNGYERWVQTGLATLVGSLVLSLLWQYLFVNHFSPRYLDVMLHGLVYFSGLVILFFVASRSAKSQGLLYIAIFSLIIASTLASITGLQDYIVNAIKLHTSEWREFGTSTPDYFAAYILLTIPITLALFLGARSGKSAILSLLYGLAFALQIAVLPTTGSRFALISLVAALIVFTFGILIIYPKGVSVPRPFKQRLIILIAGFAIIGAGFAGPVAHRLTSSAMKDQAHSMDFRVWTWRGTLKMAEQNPVLGSGPGMFEYAYTKTAIVSFTRNAHDSYLQLVSESGLLGVFGLVTAFLSLIPLVLARLKTAAKPDQNAIDSKSKSAQISNDDLSTITETLSVYDERILVVGFASAITAGLVQNLIDSDLYVTIFGVTFFIIGGLLFGIASTSSSEYKGDLKVNQNLLVKTLQTSVVLAALVQCMVWTNASLQAQSGALAKAVETSPLTGSYHADYGWNILAQQNNLPDAISELTKAVELTPDPTYYNRRSILFEHAQQISAALNDVREGLKIDPNAIPLILRGATLSDSIGDHAAALRYFKHMAELQSGVYGGVRAVTEVIEYRYSFADYALAIDAAQHHDPSATSYFNKAQTILETYCDEGGSTNINRQAQVGVNDGQLDQQLQALYGKVMDSYIAYLKPTDPVKSNSLIARKSAYFSRFLHNPAPTQ